MGLVYRHALRVACTVRAASHDDVTQVKTNPLSLSAGTTRPQTTAIHRDALLTHRSHLLATSPTPQAPSPSTRQYQRNTV